MSFGYPRRRRNDPLALLQGLLVGTQQAAQGFQVGRENRRRDELDAEARQDRLLNRQWATEDRQRAIRGEEAAGIERMAAYDPDNTLRYLTQGLAKRRGVEPPAPVPATPIFGGLGSGLASKLQQQGLQGQADTQFLTGMTGVQPGRTPQQIEQEQRLALFLRERAAKAADAEAERQSRERIAEANRVAQQGNSDLAAGSGLYGQGVDPTLIPGAVQQLRGLPVQTQVDPMEVLRRFAQGRMQRVEPTTPLERIGANPKVQADLEQSRAAIAASQAAEAASRANTGYTQERTETERLMRTPKMDALRAEIDAKRLTGKQVQARIDYMRKQGASIERRDELAALDYTRRVRADQATQADRATDNALNRDRLGFERDKFDAEAPYREARTAHTQQQLAKLNPATAAKVRGLDQRIGRIEGQINRLRMNGEDAQADALEKNLLDLVDMKDEALAAPGAVQGGASAKPAPRPRVSGGTAARGRFIAEMRRQGYTPAEAARKADAVGLR